MRAMQAPNVRNYTIPAPVGGIYNRGPEELVNEFFARDIVNMIPDQDLNIRKGYAEHASGMTGDVEFLYEHVKPDGTRVLLAGANKNIYNATSSGTATDLTSSLANFSNNRWQAVTLGGTTIIVNGADAPLAFNGTAISTGGPQFTGSGLTETNLINASVYKTRLYLVEANSTSIWYGGVGAITGALTELDTGDQLRKGGYVLYAGSWTRDTGAGMEDVFLIITSRGEILLYTGNYPGDTDTWEIVGRFQIPEPLGYRAIFSIPGDVAIITVGGTFLISALVAANDVGAQLTDYTENISKPFGEDARHYQTNWGWQGCYYGARGWTIINVPIAEDSRSKQWVSKLVNNPKSGKLINSWTRFENINAYSWSEFNRGLFFGGDDGKIYRADYGYNDDGSSIDISVKHAFSYLGSRNTKKQITAARSLMRASSSIELGYGVDMDFRSDGEVSSISNSAEASTSWGSEWGSSWGGIGASVPFQEWEMIASNTGYAASLKLEAQFKNINFELAATNLHYLPGGNF